MATQVQNNVKELYGTSQQTMRAIAYKEGAITSSNFVQAKKMNTNELRSLISENRSRKSDS